MVSRRTSVGVSGSVRGTSRILSERGENEASNMKLSAVAAEKSAPSISTTSLPSCSSSSSSDCLPDAEIFEPFLLSLLLAPFLESLLPLAEALVELLIESSSPSKSLSADFLELFLPCLAEALVALPAPSSPSSSSSSISSTSSSDTEFLESFLELFLLSLAEALVALPAPSSPSSSSSSISSTSSSETDFLESLVAPLTVILSLLESLFIRRPYRRRRETSDMVAASVPESSIRANGSRGSISTMVSTAAAETDGIVDTSVRSTATAAPK